MSEIILLNQDCRTIDPAVVQHHHLITDPPYSEHVHERMMSCAQPNPDVKGVRHRDAGFGALDDSLRDYIAYAGRIAKRWSLIYTDIQGNAAWEHALGGYTKDSKRPRHVRTIPVTDDTSGANGYPGPPNSEYWEAETDGGPVGALPWVRWSMPQFNGKCPPSGAELLVCAHAPGTMRWRGPGNLIVLKHSCLRGDGKHPTEKPLDQALDLVSWFSDPGELIYDPCAGSATLGVACVILGRSYLGCEYNSEHPEFYAQAQQRLQNVQRGILSERDEERYRRWRVSLGLSTETLALPPGALALSKGKVL